MGKSRTARLVDWKRNNKVALRNFSEACDFHDIVKLLLVRMLRRKHKDSSREPIYTEYNPIEPNENYPDIWMRDKKGDIYVWELQENVTRDWLKQITKKHEAINLIIIPLDKLAKRSLRVMKEQLKEYVI